MNVPIAVVIGFVVGAVATAVAVVLVMRSSMVVPEPSSRSFEATCEAIEKVVPGAEGWSFPMESLDMGAKLAAKNAMPDNVKRIRLYFMCNPQVAKVVLGANPKLSAIMPCSWSVYELADGSVWVAHMNIGLMAKMMGGVVGSSMAEVAATDERFLEAVLH
ncbi:MAG TPA: DUF302 domain-containing protein [Candidatus Sulfomarinibacteraceae bacterium]|nr:DUF302 domain-containing protein [Candidatus Sulfomarinibacteraceae bacterium]